MDPVKILPSEVIETIFGYLGLDDLLGCCLVSQKWNFAGNNDTLWKQMCLKNDWSDFGSLKKYLSCFSILSNDCASHHFNNFGEWRKHYVLKNQIQKNWRSGKFVDCDINPPKRINGNDVGNISSVSSDGHNLLAFGFTRGLLSLFKLENNGSELLVHKNCPLNLSVDYIEIINEYLVLVQENLFLMYKLENDDLELYRAKSINTSSVTDLNVETFMLMDPNSRTELIRRTKGLIDDNVLYHFTESYLVITTTFSHRIYVYDINNFIEPSAIFNLKEIEIDTTNKVIVNVHNRRDTVYVLLSSRNNAFTADANELNLSKFSIHAFSIKSRKLLFSNSVMHNEFISHEAHECKIETNDKFLVLRFETLFFFVFDRIIGNLLLSEEGLVFLNANSNPSLVGVWMSGNFRVTDPTNRGCYFCCTSDNTPIALFKDILVTSSVEFDGDGVGSTFVEFWYIYWADYDCDEEEMKYVLTFSKNSNVALIYKDDTKLIFYVERDHVLVRSFLA